MAVVNQMKQTIKDNVEGWDLSLNKNVHMYCHDLSAQFWENLIQIQCEDLPNKEKTIGVWLTNLELSDERKRELQSVLLQWANKLEVTFQIYVSGDEFVTNNDGG